MESLNRLQQIIDYQEISQKQLAELTGFSKSTISKILSNQIGIPKSLVSALTDKLNINSNWLLNGIGNMHISQMEKRYEQALKESLRDSPFYNVEEPNAVYLSPDKLKFVTVPLVSVAASAGFVLNNCDVAYEELETYPVGAHARGVDIAFEVRGDSMEPEIMDGSIVLCRRILEPRFIASNFKTVYVVAWGEDLHIKFIENNLENGGNFVLHSVQNTVYPPIKINPDDIRGIWKVEWKLARQ